MQAKNFNVIDCNKTWLFSEKQIGYNGESEVGNITEKQKKLGKKNLKLETQILLKSSMWNWKPNFKLGNIVINI